VVADRAGRRPRKARDVADAQTLAGGLPGRRTAFGGVCPGACGGGTRRARCGQRLPHGRAAEDAEHAAPTLEWLGRMRHTTEPCRSACRPARGEAMSMPTASGISLIPAVIGELPWAPWK